MALSLSTFFPPIQNKLVGRTNHSGAPQGTNAFYTLTPPAPDVEVPARLPLKKAYDFRFPRFSRQTHGMYAFPRAGRLLQNPFFPKEPSFPYASRSAPRQDGPVTTRSLCTMASSVPVPSHPLAPGPPPIRHVWVLSVQLLPPHPTKESSYPFPSTLRLISSTFWCVFLSSKPHPDRCTL